MAPWAVLNRFVRLFVVLGNSAEQKPPGEAIRLLDNTWTGMGVK